ncbi:MAG: biotin--[acetyl-CoA-carboxylase] ligase [Eubacteriales bacterium]|nr:biotin--[acetyl-CoA-carboxylase] ligase [Eubacteriales bacterium]
MRLEEIITYQPLVNDGETNETDALLTLLATGEPIAEAVLCQRLNLCQTELAVLLAALRAQGYHIQETGGLCLVPEPGSLLPGDILWELRTGRMGRGAILYAPQMGSTNTELKKAAAVKVLAEGSLAVCDRQTHGKGRLQRAWADADAAESLACSLLLRPKLPPERTPLYTLVVAVAAAEAIYETTGLATGIKWPNDVVIGSRKCVGILCEAAADPEGRRFVVAGAGFNVNQQTFTGELAAKATSLFIESGHTHDRRTLLCHYLRHMERVTDVLEKDGLAGLYTAYAARSITLGRRVRVESAAETFTGKAERIDDTGALWVRTDDGAQQRVLSGDVSVRGVMGYV